MTAPLFLLICCAAALPLAANARTPDLPSARFTAPAALLHMLKSDRPH
ncbi:MAG: hypothetical protein IJ943_05390 [Akkermansia sp.]|nr:hypothetical protein [Akkermansia sp.]